MTTYLKLPLYNNNMARLFQYANNAEYRGRSSSDEWRVDDLGQELEATSVHHGYDGSVRTVNYGIDEDDVHNAFIQIDQIEELPENLYIDESNEAPLAVELAEEDGFFYEPLQPIHRPGKNNVFAQKQGNNSGSVVFDADNSLEKNGWIIDSNNLRKGEWVHKFEGRLGDPYSEIVGTPEEYHFRAPSNLEYDPRELPKEALIMLSNLHIPDQPNEESLISSILEGGEVKGREWVVKKNRNDADGLINQMTDRVIEVQGSIIPEKLENTWKRGVENAEHR